MKTGINTTFCTATGLMRFACVVCGKILGQPVMFRLRAWVFAVNCSVFPPVVRIFEIIALTGYDLIMAENLAREIRIVAYFGLQVRLDTLVVAAVKYKQALASLDDKELEVVEAREVLVEAERLTDMLPAHLGLVDAARKQHVALRAQLRAMKVTLAQATEELFDVAGSATQVVLDILEEQASKPNAMTIKEALDVEAIRGS